MSVRSSLPVRLLPIWSAVHEQLRIGRSVLLYTPRQCGAPELVEALSSTLDESKGFTWVRLRMHAFLGAGGLDYARVWSVVATKLNTPSPVEDVEDKNSFKEALHQAVLAHGHPVVIVISGMHNAFEHDLHDFTFILYELLQRLDLNGVNPLSILLVDDYTLYYYGNWRARWSSTVDYLRPVEHEPLSEDDIREALRRLDPSPPDAGATADWLTILARGALQLTGGHPGLVLEVLNAFSSAGEDAVRNGPEFLASVGEQLRRSPVLSAMERALEENPPLLCGTALQFVSPRPLANPGQPEPNVQHLRRIGVLQWQPLNRVRLCPGVVREMVESLHADAEQHMRGGSARAGDAEPLELDNDDLVLLHLSDLHVGPHFRFRRSEDDYTGSKFADDMLHDDLSRLGLINRVDGLIVSGDFAETGGELTPFEDAYTVLDRIRRRLKLEWDQVAIVAGNHDLNWTPADGEAPHRLTGVGRDNYEKFCEKLGKEAAAASLVAIRSRGGRRALRLVGLDSNLVEGPQAGGIGYVGEDSIEVANRLLSQAGEIAEHVHTWVVVHHHIFPVSSPTPAAAHSKRVSVFANASDLLLHTENWCAEAILHGHEHQPAVTIAHRWTSPTEANAEPFSRVVTIGAGSFALKAELGLIGKNQYFVLCRRDRDLVLLSRVLKDNGFAFVHHDRIRIDMTPDR